MKKIVAVVFLAIVACIGSANAQDSSGYKNAIGFISLPGGISLKHFVKANDALEGIIYFDQETIRLTGLYEHHYDIVNVIDGMKWFVGGGVHVGTWTNTYKERNHKRSGNSETTAGIDGVIGIDYKIDAWPIKISAQWEPNINLKGYVYYEGLTWGGVTIAYTF